MIDASWYRCPIIINTVRVQTPCPNRPGVDLCCLYFVFGPFTIKCMPWECTQATIVHCILCKTVGWTQPCTHTHTHTQMWTVYACVDVCMYSFMTLIYIRTVLNGKHLPSEEQQWITAGEARQTTEVPHEVMIPHKKQLTDISQVLASPTHSTLGCISTLGVWINKPGALVQSLRAETKEGFAACGVEGSVVDWIMLSLRRGSFSPLSFLQKASSPLSPLRTGNTVHACEFVDLWDRKSVV